MEDKQRLWLHVGPAKTGTTSIQNTLFRNRETLRSAGVLYPLVPENKYSSARYAHHFLSQALVASDVGLIDSFFSNMPEAPDTILSSEGLANGLSGQYVDVRALLTQRYQTKVVYYVRDPVARATSLAQQFLKTARATLADLQESPPHVPLRKHIIPLIKAFGQDSVILRKFAPDSFPDGDLIADFCLGIRKPELAQQLKVARMNESITMEAAEKIDLYRRQTGDLRVIRPNDPEFRIGETRFHLSDTAKQIIRDRSAKDLEWLRDAYGMTF